MALNPPLPPWPDCRIWVIGASTGIGAATAKAMLAAGARVALSARKTDLLGEVAGGNSRALIEPLDYTESTQVAAATERVRAASAAEMRCGIGNALRSVSGVCTKPGLIR